jgi:hypothetical protein
MPVTENVIRDLLPVYAAGEASPDTRALVEKYLETAPELKATLDSAAALELPAAAPPPALGPRALQHTRDLLARKTFLTGFSFYFSTLAMAFLYRPWQIHWLPYRGPLIVATIFMLVGLAGWALFFNTCRRLHSTGLQPRRSMKQIWVWMFGTWAVCHMYGLVIDGWAGTHNFQLYAGPGAILVWLLARRFGQIPDDDTLRELSRPISLFHDRPEN